MQEHLIALLGHPVTHSKSPAMQNAAFRSQGLPYQYMAFDVSPESLGVAIKGLRALGFKGANITIPHKISILPYLDEITPLASGIGAVNTLFYINGRLVGDNTDGQGYLASLKQEFPHINLKDMVVGIIGAGGAARAVAFTMAHNGIKKIYITNRTIEKGIELATELAAIIDIEWVKLEQFKQIISQLDLLIQTTSVGMSPNVDYSIIPVERIHPNMIVSDLIYNPIETKLLQEAKKQGALTHNGVGMLVQQGALSYELWTGKRAPIDLMTEVLLNSLMS